MATTVGVVGLGSMGRPMATNLLAAGFPLVVHNRTRQRVEALASRGAEVAPSPAAAAGPAAVMVTMVADDRALEAVVFGEGGILEARTTWASPCRSPVWRTTCSSRPSPAARASAIGRRWPSCCARRRASGRAEPWTPRRGAPGAMASHTKSTRDEVKPWRRRRARTAR